VLRYRRLAFGLVILGLFTRFLVIRELARIAQEHARQHAVDQRRDEQRRRARPKALEIELRKMRPQVVTMMVLS
jgi:hypothetical protein